MAWRLTRRRWATLLALAGTGDHPHELLVTALTRARVCELLAAGDPAADPDRAFTAGLLSIADALLQAPLDAALAELPLDARLADALLHHTGPQGEILALALALAHERGDWDDREITPRGVSLAAASWEAPQWANTLAAAIPQ